MLKELLMSSEYFKVNIELAHTIGLYETIVLSILVEIEEQSEQKEFSVTYKQISDKTTLSNYQIRKAINNLKNLDIIETRMKGLPAKLYFTINSGKKE